NFNTFSITAKCARTGKFGIVISTKVTAVGSLCIYAKAGIGAIASHSFVNTYICIHSLGSFVDVYVSASAFERLVKEEQVPEIRQFSIVDQHGAAVAYTGEKCDTWRGHLTGDHYAVAGNMLVGEETLQAMAKQFEASKADPFSERLLQALHAG